MGQLKIALVAEPSPDHCVANIADVLRTEGHHVSAILHPDDEEQPEAGLDLVIGFGPSMKWFLNRECTWKFGLLFANSHDDFLHLAREDGQAAQGIQKAIHYIYTNSPLFAGEYAQIKSTCRLAPVDDVFTSYPLRPHDVVQLERTELRCIVENIADRDFSFVAWVAKRFPDRTALCLPASVMDMQDPEEVIPSELIPFLRVYDDDGEYHDLFRSALLYIPAPRIGDYRFHICPPELFRAAIAGTMPVMPLHPVIRPIGQHLPLAESLKQAGAFIKNAIAQDPTWLKQELQAMVNFHAAHVEMLSARSATEAIINAYEESA